MSSNKFKRRKEVEDKKSSKKGFFGGSSNVEQIKAEEIEQQKYEHELALRKEAYEALKRLELKLKLVKEKNKELDTKFLLKREQFDSKEAFEKTFNENKQKRQTIINQLEDEFEQRQKEYKINFEVGSYKIKRWFYGMGKEFGRINWLNKKGVWEGFVTVFLISILLALIFLAIDAIFSVGLF